MHGVQGLSVWGGGLLRAPSQALFHTHLWFFPAPGFFFVFFLAFEASVRTGELVLRLRDECRDQAKLG